MKLLLFSAEPPTEPPTCRPSQENGSNLSRNFPPPRRPCILSRLQGASCSHGRSQEGRPSLQYVDYHSPQTTFFTSPPGCAAAAGRRNLSVLFRSLPIFPASQPETGFSWLDMPVTWDVCQATKSLCCRLVSYLRQHECSIDSDASCEICAVNTHFGTAILSWLTSLLMASTCCTTLESAEAVANPFAEVSEIASNTHVMGRQADLASLACVVGAALNCSALSLALGTDLDLRVTAVLLQLVEVIQDYGPNGSSVNNNARTSAGSEPSCDSRRVSSGRFLYQACLMGLQHILNRRGAPLRGEKETPDSPYFGYSGMMRSISNVGIPVHIAGENSITGTRELNAPFGSDLFERALDLLRRQAVDGRCRGAVMLIELSSSKDLKRRRVLEAIVHLTHQLKRLQRQPPDNWLELDFLVWCCIWIAQNIYSEFTASAIAMLFVEILFPRPSTDTVYHVLPSTQFTSCDGEVTEDTLSPFEYMCFTELYFPSRLSFGIRMLLVCAGYTGRVSEGSMLSTQQSDGLRNTTRIPRRRSKKEQKIGNLGQHDGDYNSNMMYNPGEADCTKTACFGEMLVRSLRCHNSNTSRAVCNFDLIFGEVLLCIERGMTVRELHILSLLCQPPFPEEASKILYDATAQALFHCLQSNVNPVSIVGITALPFLGILPSARSPTTLSAEFSPPRLLVASPDLPLPRAAPDACLQPWTESPETKQHDICRHASEPLHMQISDNLSSRHDCSANKQRVTPGGCIRPHRNNIEDKGSAWGRGQGADSSEQVVTLKVRLYLRTLFSLWRASVEDNAATRSVWHWGSGNDGVSDLCNTLQPNFNTLCIDSRNRTGFLAGLNKVVGIATEAFAFFVTTALHACHIPVNKQRIPDDGAVWEQQQGVSGMCSIIAEFHAWVIVCRHICLDAMDILLCGLFQIICLLFDDFDSWVLPKSPNWYHCRLVLSKTVARIMHCHGNASHEQAFPPKSCGARRRDLSVKKTRGDTEDGLSDPRRVGKKRRSTVCGFIRSASSSGGTKLKKRREKLGHVRARDDTENPGCKTTKHLVITLLEEPDKGVSSNVEGPRLLNGRERVWHANQYGRSGLTFLVEGLQNICGEVWRDRLVYGGICRPREMWVERQLQQATLNVWCRYLRFFFLPCGSHGSGESCPAAASTTLSQPGLASVPGAPRHPAPRRISDAEDDTLIPTTDPKAVDSAGCFSPASVVSSSFPIPAPGAHLPEMQFRFLSRLFTSETAGTLIPVPAPIMSVQQPHLCSTVASAPEGQDKRSPPLLETTPRWTGPLSLGSAETACCIEQLMGFIAVVSPCLFLSGLTTTFSLDLVADQNLRIRKANSLYGEPSWMKEMNRETLPGSMSRGTDNSLRLQAALIRLADNIYPTQWAELRLLTPTLLWRLLAQALLEDLRGQNNPFPDSLLYLCDEMERESGAFYTCAETVSSAAAEPLLHTHALKAAFQWDPYRSVALFLLSAVQDPHLRVSRRALKLLTAVEQKASGMFDDPTVLAGTAEAIEVLTQRADIRNEWQHNLEYLAGLLCTGFQTSFCRRPSLLIDSVLGRVVNWIAAVHSSQHQQRDEPTYGKDSDNNRNTGSAGGDRGFRPGPADWRAHQCDDNGMLLRKCEASHKHLHGILIMAYGLQRAATYSQRRQISKTANEAASVMDDYSAEGKLVLKLISEEAFPALMNLGIAGEVTRRPSRPRAAIDLRKTGSASAGYSISDDVRHIVSLISSTLSHVDLRFFPDLGKNILCFGSVMHALVLASDKLSFRDGQLELDDLNGRNYPNITDTDGREVVSSFADECRNVACIRRLLRATDFAGLMEHLLRKVSDFCDAIGKPDLFTSIGYGDAVRVGDSHTVHTVVPASNTARYLHQNQMATASCGTSLGYGRSLILDCILSGLVADDPPGGSSVGNVKDHNGAVSADQEGKWITQANSVCTPPAMYARRTLMALRKEPGRRLMTGPALNPISWDTGVSCCGIFNHHRKLEPPLVRCCGHHAHPEDSLSRPRNDLKLIDMHDASGRNLLSDGVNPLKFTQEVQAIETRPTDIPGSANNLKASAVAPPLQVRHDGRVHQLESIVWQFCGVIVWSMECVNVDEFDESTSNDSRGPLPSRLKQDSVSTIALQVVVHMVLRYKREWVIRVVSPAWKSILASSRVADEPIHDRGTDIRSRSSKKRHQLRWSLYTMIVEAWKRDITDGVGIFGVSGSSHQVGLWMKPTWPAVEQWDTFHAQLNQDELGNSTRGTQRSSIQLNNISSAKQVSQAADHRAEFDSIVGFQHRLLIFVIEQLDICRNHGDHEGQRILERLVEISISSLSIGALRIGGRTKAEPSRNGVTYHGVLREVDPFTAGTLMCLLLLVKEGMAISARMCLRYARETQGSTNCNPNTLPSLGIKERPNTVKAMSSIAFHASKPRETSQHWRLHGSRRSHDLLVHGGMEILESLVTSGEDIWSVTPSKCYECCAYESDTKLRSIPTVPPGSSSSENCENGGLMAGGLERNGKPWKSSDEVSRQEDTNTGDHLCCGCLSQFAAIAKVLGDICCSLQAAGRHSLQPNRSMAETFCSRLLKTLRFYPATVPERSTLCCDCWTIGFPQTAEKSTVPNVPKSLKYNVPKSGLLDSRRAPWVRTFCNRPDAEDFVNKAESRVGTATFRRHGMIPPATERSATIRYCLVLELLQDQTSRLQLVRLRSQASSEGQFGISYASAHRQPSVTVADTGESPACPSFRCSSSGYQQDRTLQGVRPTVTATSSSRWLTQTPFRSAERQRVRGVAASQTPIVRCSAVKDGTEFQKKVSRLSALLLPSESMYQNGTVQQEIPIVGHSDLETIWFRFPKLICEVISRFNISVHRLANREPRLPYIVQSYMLHFASWCLQTSHGYMSLLQLFFLVDRTSGLSRLCCVGAPSPSNPPIGAPTIETDSAVLLTSDIRVDSGSIFWLYVHKMPVAAVLEVMSWRPGESVTISENSAHIVLLSVVTRALLCYPHTVWSFYTLQFVQCLRNEDSSRLYSRAFLEMCRRSLLFCLEMYLSLGSHQVDADAPNSSYEGQFGSRIDQLRSDVLCHGMGQGDSTTVGISGLDADQATSGASLFLKLLGLLDVLVRVSGELCLLEPPERKGVLMNRLKRIDDRLGKSHHERQPRHDTYLLPTKKLCFVAGIDWRSGRVLQSATKAPFLVDFIVSYPHGDVPDGRRRGSRAFACLMSTGEDNVFPMTEQEIRSTRKSADDGWRSNSKREYKSMNTRNLMNRVLTAGFRSIRSGRISTKKHSGMTGYFDDSDAEGDMEEGGDLHSAVNQVTIPADEKASQMYWKLSFIFKLHDDVRQDQLAVQILRLFRSVFRKSGLHCLWLRPYNILSYRPGVQDAQCATSEQNSDKIGASTVTTDPLLGLASMLQDVSVQSSNLGGAIECVPNCVSRHQIGKTMKCSLLEYFVRLYGPSTGHRFQQALRNFINSLAPYSVFTFVIQVKDRHNGNLMITELGHIFHIDFGFLFDISPGHDIRFERAPFKLTTEMLDLMGGRCSRHFAEFKHLCVISYLAIREQGHLLLLLVELMHGSGYVCFKKKTLSRLRWRLQLDKSPQEASEFIIGKVHESCNSITTKLYDIVQSIQQGIEH
eukprot:GHVQ01020827.1.p1 GENE.GHVQ01020827.1~~GHVQ01020827.1.p1  ORF type:complete len:3596 (+),score=305.35 GHVQ01020827.1:915-11702(+)